MLSGIPPVKQVYMGFSRSEWSAECAGDQDEAVEGDVANDDPDVDPEGPIKEHLLGEVHKRRGQKRKERTFGNDNDSENILDQYDAPEHTGQQQDGELQNDDGPALAAFNMDEAEQEEAGLGGEKKKDEEEEDAWLQSLHDQVCCPLATIANSLSMCTSFQETQ